MGTSTLRRNSVGGGIRQEEILRLFLLGVKTKDIAKRFNIRYETVNALYRTEEFRDRVREKGMPLIERLDEEIRSRNASLTERINELSSRALDRIQELLESDDERVVAKVAGDVLDRNPETSKHHKVDTTSRVFTLDATQLALAAQAAFEVEGKQEEALRGS